MGFCFKEQSDFSRLPSVLQFLFGIISVLGYMMFLQMVHTRFDIILYTRAVNGVRAYFAMRASQVGIAEFEKYLKLPTKLSVPPYREGISRAYWWQFLMISVIDSTFAGLFAWNVSTWCVAGLVAIVFFGIHTGSYYGMSHAREKREILGVSK